MNKRFTNFVFSALLTPIAICITVTAWAAGERPQVGGVDRLEKSATASYEADKRSLAAHDPVLFQDVIETTGEARLAITLEDGTTITLGENASVRIDEFVYEPDNQTGKLGLSVLEGAFLFVGGETENLADSEVEIDTSVGTLGVRGTTVWGGRIDGSYGVLCADGAVTVRSAAGEVNLTAGEGTSIASKDTAPTAPKKWPEEKVQRAVATISFSE